MGQKGESRGRMANYWLDDTPGAIGVRRRVARVKVSVPRVRRGVARRAMLGSGTGLGMLRHRSTGKSYFDAKVDWTDVGKNASRSVVRATTPHFQLETNVAHSKHGDSDWTIWLDCGNLTMQLVTVVIHDPRSHAR